MAGVKIRKAGIPGDSILTRYYPADYTDSFRLTADTGTGMSPDDIMTGFWLDMPGWVNAMFKLRNTLAGLAGLKSSEGRSPEKLEQCIREGGSYGFADVTGKTERETVVALKDKHLDAYISILKADDRNVYASTLVRYKNRMGRVYFFFVRPFHGIIVKALLKRTVKNGHIRT